MPGERPVWTVRDVAQERRRRGPQSVEIGEERLAHRRARIVEQAPQCRFAAGVELFCCQFHGRQQKKKSAWWQLGKARLKQGKLCLMRAALGTARHLPPRKVQVVAGLGEVRAQAKSSLVTRRGIGRPPERQKHVAKIESVG